MLLHAITDALLGAAALGDIGELFPDTDAANRGRDSAEMLRRAAAKVRAAGYRDRESRLHRLRPAAQAQRRTRRRFASRIAEILELDADASRRESQDRRRRRRSRPRRSDHGPVRGAAAVDDI